MLKRVHRQRGGEPGRANGHRLLRRQPVRQRHQPLRRNACVLGESAVVGDAEVVAVRDHLGADREAGVAGLDDLTREVDTGDDRVDAGHLALGQTWRGRPCS